jgi:Methylase of chemotaxis methyl-accepting proteins
MDQTTQSSQTLAKKHPRGEFKKPSMLAGSLQIKDRQYNELVDLIYRLSGINLGQGKRELLRARLAKRMRVIGMRSLPDYMELLRNDQSGRELVYFLDCITTNKTDFFRESQHFDFMAKSILPNLDRLCGPGNPLVIWSAACSTGEEPYTLAIVLNENASFWQHQGAAILASDLSTKVLDQAKAGVYLKERVANLPRALLSKYFQRGSKRWEGYVRVKPFLKSLVQYRRSI